MARGTARVRDRITTALLVLALLVGLGLIAYPSVSDWWNTLHASRVVNQYDQIVGRTSAQDADQMLQAARDYNDELRGRTDKYAWAEAEEVRYETLLNVDGNGAMGYVQIPRLNLTQPIGHGTRDSVLQRVIGHMEGTSLPVGGAGTHAVLIGHRGLPSAKLFTDIDRLIAGDLFYVNVLGQTMTYEVDEIHTVLPDDLSHFEIDPDADLCTLVTCTPYGINSHRLLVRGRRVDKGRDARVFAEAAFVDQRLVAIVLAAIMTVVAIAGVLAGTFVWRRLH